MLLQHVLQVEIHPLAFRDIGLLPRLVCKLHLELRLTLIGSLIFRPVFRRHMHLCISLDGALIPRVDF